MGYEIPGFGFTLPANSDLSSSQFRFLTVNSSGKALLATAAAKTIGVLNNKPKTDEAATVTNSGIVMVKADAAITCAADVEVGSSSGAVTASSGVKVGIALETAGGAGEIIAVLLTNNN